MGFKTYPHGWGINKTWDLAYTTFIVNDGSLQSDSVSASDCKLWYRVVSPTSSPVSGFLITAGVREGLSLPPVSLSALIYSVNATGATNSLVAISSTFTVSSNANLQQEVIFTFPASTILTKDSVFYINISASGSQTPTIPSILIWDHYVGLDETEYIGTYNYRYYHTDGYPFTTFYQITPSGSPWLMNEELRISAGLLIFEDGTMFGSPWSMTETVSSVDSSLIPVAENCSINSGIKRGGMVQIPKSCWLHGAEVKITFPLNTGIVINGSGSVPSGMVLIPAGSFLMGNTGLAGVETDEGTDEEFPQHEVSLDNYYIGKYEVTRGEYRQFMDAGGYSTSAYWSTGGWSWKIDQSRVEPDSWAAELEMGLPAVPFIQTDNHPVIGVTYYEAEAFCNWVSAVSGVNCHLPTEAQWEKAARWDSVAATGYVFPWGNTFDANKVNGYNGVSVQTTSGGSYPDGASPYGCMDMAGNVFEWCQDWWVSYPGGTPFDYTGDWRVLKGGSCGKTEADLRPSQRIFSTYSDTSEDDIGFRITIEASSGSVITSTTESVSAFLYHRTNLIASKVLFVDEIKLKNENTSARTIWVRFNFDTPLYLIEGETYRLVIGATNLSTDDPVGIPVYKCWNTVADNSSLKPISFPYTSLENGTFTDSVNDDCGLSIIVSWDELDETRRRQYGRE